MNDLLLNSAEVLSEEVAGGHGDRWGVFVGGSDVAIEKLVTTIKSAELFNYGLADNAAMEAIVAAGEPWGTLLLYTGQEKGMSRTGAMSLIGQLPGGTGRKQLWSAYPFFGDGTEVDGFVDRLLLHPNRVEATLEIGLENGALISAFDPLFCLHRTLYREGISYRFSLAALAYTMTLAPQREIVIDDPDEIRQFRARTAWVEQHGKWTREDEAAALAAWQPKKPEDSEPIRFNASHTTAYWPTGFSDDSGYLGEVVCVTPGAVRLFDTTFWCIDVKLISDDEGDLIVPIYVSECLFEGDWRPSVGIFVTGTLWMQAYAKSPSS